MSEAADQLDLTCVQFDSALELLQSLGLRLDVIYPADEPHTAILSREGGTVRLTARPDALAPSATLPSFKPEFVLARADGAGGRGRAGMVYRDLIPGRLGGRYVASAIGIADGGPVADWVHHHRLAFQIVAVRRGWVRVVYEGQGRPFVMAPGDLVLQPPGIRHRVLESSDGLEVVEVSCPALHETLADHGMTLPNGEDDPARDYSGQRFLRHIGAAAAWSPFHGGEAQHTGLAAATRGLADAQFIRRGAGPAAAFPAHDGELNFGFVMEGRVTLDRGDCDDLGPADAFVIPPGDEWRLRDPSDDFVLLHVATSRFGP